jgi:hypothetical protein
MLKPDKNNLAIELKLLQAKICVCITLVPFLLYPATFIGSFFIRKWALSWPEIFEFWGFHASRAIFLESYQPSFSYPWKVVFGVIRNLFLLGYTQLTTAMEMLIFNSAMLLNDSVQDFSLVVKDMNNVSCYQASF